MEYTKKTRLDCKGKSLVVGNIIKYSRHDGKGLNIGSIHAIGKYALHVIDILPENNTKTIIVRAVVTSQVNRWELEDRI